MSEPAGVRLVDLTKRYGEIAALDGLSLDVGAGELVALVGPSGSGKSTALRAIAGLEHLDSGQVWIGGREVTRAPAHRRDVAMVFQDYALYPHLTVEANLAFGMRVRREPAAVVSRRIGRVVGQLAIADTLDRYPDQLSGGQQQRVALARAMVREPGVYLMDEPLSNLDAQLRLGMRTEIVELHNRLGTTTVYVTHDQAEAMTVGDRIAVLRDGRLQQLAPPQEVYDRPANRFVASFVGSPPMNLLPGGGVLGGEQGTEVGVRPEDLRLVGPGDEAVAGEVSAVESLGSETIVVVHVDGGQRLVVRAPPRVAARVGERVRVAADRARVHVFDASSGERRR